MKSQRGRLRATALAAALALLLGSTVASAQSLQPLTQWAYTPNNHLFWTIGGSPGGGWTYIGLTGYCYDSAATGTVPLHRWFHAGNSHHFYTIGSGNPGAGWAYEGAACYVFSSQQVGTVPLHRWYTSCTGKHYYTTGSARQRVVCTRGSKATSLHPSKNLGALVELPIHQHGG